MKKVAIALLVVSIVAASVLLGLAFEEPFEPLVGCKSDEELKVYCNFMNPEDLALTPDGDFLIVAEFGGMAPLVEMTFGDLSLFNVRIKPERKPIFLSEAMSGAQRIVLEI